MTQISQILCNNSPESKYLCTTVLLVSGCDVNYQELHYIIGSLTAMQPTISRDLP